MITVDSSRSSAVSTSVTSAGESSSPHGVCLPKACAVPVLEVDEPGLAASVAVARRRPSAAGTGCAPTQLDSDEPSAWMVSASVDHASGRGTARRRALDPPRGRHARCVRRRSARSAPSRRRPRVGLEVGERDRLRTSPAAGPGPRRGADQPRRRCSRAPTTCRRRRRRSTPAGRWRSGTVVGLAPVRRGRRWTSGRRLVVVRDPQLERAPSSAPFTASDGIHETADDRGLDSHGAPPASSCPDEPSRPGRAPRASQLGVRGGLAPPTRRWLPPWPARPICV